MDAADVVNYESRQIRIEAKIDALARHMEVNGWDAQYEQISKLPSVTGGRENSLKPSWMGLLHARTIGGFINSTGRLYRSNQKKESTKMKKFTSRKFILAVSGAILIILNDGLELGIDSDTVLAFAGLLATWIVGESAVDANRASKSMNEPGDTGPAE